MDCNTGIGKLGDSVGGLDRAKAYLAKFIETLPTQATGDNGDTA